MDQTVTTPKRRIAKPLGVYIILTFDFVIFGIFPLLEILSLSRKPDVELPLVVLVPIVTLAVVSMAACVWAWTGDNPARYLVVGVVTVSALVFILGHTLVLTNSGLPGLERFGSTKYLIRNVFWIVINCWYFFRKSTADYYKQHTWS